MIFCFVLFYSSPFLGVTVLRLKESSAICVRKRVLNNFVDQNTRLLFFRLWMMRKLKIFTFDKFSQLLCARFAVQWYPARV